MIRDDLGVLFGDEGEPIVPVEFAQPTRIAGAENAPELCQLASRWTVADHPDNAIGQVKLDGWRALYIGGDLVTREGMALHHASHSLRALKELERAYGEPMFFDGEYVHPEGLEACSRPGGTIWLFDALPLEAWQTGAGIYPLHMRLHQLLDRGQHCFGPALGALKSFNLGGGGAGAQAAVQKAEDLWRCGYEGLVVKDGNALYERRRSSTWRKLKQWRTAPFRIIDIVTSDGMLALILISVEGRQQRLNVRHLDKATRTILATRIKPGDRAVVEFTGTSEKTGALRDAVFVRMEG